MSPQGGGSHLHNKERPREGPLPAPGAPGLRGNGWPWLRPPILAPVTAAPASVHVPAHGCPGPCVSCPCVSQPTGVLAPACSWADFSVVSESGGDIGSRDPRGPRGTQPPSHPLRSGSGRSDPACGALTGAGLVEPGTAVPRCPRRARANLHLMRNGLSGFKKNLVT